LTPPTIGDHIVRRHVRMDRDRIIRRVLWAAAGFNVVGAVLFAFPGSVLGRLADLPMAVPVAYRAIAAMFVLLFGGAYAWLATQPSPSRPLLAFGAIGKASAFAVVAGLWLASEASTRALAAIGGDLVFAAVFAWWLIGAPPERARRGE
jgi:hypothetical protein